MQKQLLPEYSEQERLRIMRDNYASAHETYYKELDHDEIAAREQSLSKNSIDIFKLEKKLKEIKQEFKDQIDPLKDDNSKLMTEIDTGQEETKGELFFVPNYDENTMITYDAKGRYVSQRRLKPGEQRRAEFGGLRPAANDE